MSTAMILRSGLVIAAAVLASTGLGACQTLPPIKGTPALLSNTSAEILAELTEVISGALHGVRVTLAPDTLTTSPTVIIERAGHSSLGGDPMIGRKMDRPDHFSLSLSNGHCVLTHDETDTHYALAHAKCKAME